MNSRNVLTVFRKEIRDTLRDRRTLFVAVVLPVLINPLLFIFLFMVATTQTEKTRKEEFSVTFIGHEHAPRLTKIISNFKTPDMLGVPLEIPGPNDPIRERKAGEKGAVVVALPADAKPVPAQRAAFIAAVKAGEIGDVLDDDGAQQLFEKADVDGDGVLNAAEQQRVAAIRMLLEEKTHVVIVFPPNFETDLGKTPKLAPEILYFGASDRSDTAAQHIREILHRYTEPFAFRPLDVQTTDVKTGSKVAKEIARFLPYLIILMVLTAAFTPAIDLMAGEKERGTIETLLISPADRRELILGKFICVTVIAVCAATLNLLSLGITLNVIGAQVSAMTEKAQDRALQQAMEQTAADSKTDRSGPQTQTAPLSQTQPQTHPGSEPATTPAQPPTSLPLGNRRISVIPEIPFLLYPIILLLMIPAAALFGAVTLALSAFAKSHKEGQYYLTPLMMIAIPLSMISLMPGVQFNWRWGLVPISNFSLLFRDLMTHISTDGSTGIPAGLWLAVIEVVAVTALYAYLALRWATANFYREDVLFREAEELTWQFWKRPGPPRATPSQGAGLLGFVLSLILFFFVGSAWQLEANTADEFLRAHVMTQLLLIAGPAFVLIALNKYDRGRVLPIRKLPPVDAVVGVLLLMPALAIVMIQVLVWLAQVFEVSLVDRGASDAIEFLGELSPFTLLVIIALVPGVCEEILFRGFVLAGLVPDAVKQGKTRRADNRVPTPWGAIVLTAVLFGLMHLAAIRIPITTAMGIVLGWIMWRSGSLLLAMGAHLIYNATPILGIMLLGGGAVNSAMLLGLPTWLLVLALVVAASGATLIHLSTRRTEPPFVGTPTSPR